MMKFLKSDPSYRIIDKPVGIRIVCGDFIGELMAEKVELTGSETGLGPDGLAELDSIFNIIPYDVITVQNLSKGWMEILQR